MFKSEFSCVFGVVLSSFLKDLYSILVKIYFGWMSFTWGQDIISLEPEDKLQM